MKEISIEKCLDSVANKFDLSVLVMNRAKEILLNEGSSDVEITKHTKKSVTRAIKEIEDNKIDIDLLKYKIQNNLISVNVFSKDELDTSSINSNDIDNIEDMDDIIEDSETDIDEEDIDEDDIEEEDIEEEDIDDSDIKDN